MIKIAVSSDSCCIATYWCSITAKMQIDGLAQGGCFCTYQDKDARAAQSAGMVGCSTCMTQFMACFNPALPNMGIYV